MRNSRPRRTVLGRKGKVRLVLLWGPLLLYDRAIAIAICTCDRHPGVLGERVA